MRVERKRHATTAEERDPGARRSLVFARTELEAALLAHRCGWQTLDDIRLKKLELALKAVLRELGQPDPAEALIRRN